MIQLPDNFMDAVRVDTRSNRLVIHVKNDASQYFTHVHILDKAATFDEHLQALAATEYPNARAYVLLADLTTELVDPVDQNWVPAPIPVELVLSIPQYRESQRE